MDAQGWRVTGQTLGIPAGSSTHSCNCIGPQRGQPRCPCGMRGIVARDGRWVQLERDLGPVLPEFSPPTPKEPA